MTGKYEKYSLIHRLIIKCQNKHLQSAANCRILPRSGSSVIFLFVKQTDSHRHVANQLDQIIKLFRRGQCC